MILVDQESNGHISLPGTTRLPAADWFHGVDIWSNDLLVAIKSVFASLCSKKCGWLATPTSMINFIQDLSSQQEPWLIKVKIGYCNRYSNQQNANKDECQWMFKILINTKHSYPSLWQTVPKLCLTLSFVGIQIRTASPRWSQHQWLQLCFWVDFCTRWTTSGHAVKRRRQESL